MLRCEARNLLRYGTPFRLLGFISILATYKVAPNLLIKRLAKNKCANNRTKAQIISSNNQWLLPSTLL